jgi:type IV secretory pathway TrbD component
MTRGRAAIQHSVSLHQGWSGAIEMIGDDSGKQMARSKQVRRNKVFKAMNRPMTILGAERRLFFVALISGGAVFSLMHSLAGGILLFVLGTLIAQRATKYDVEILRVLMNSAQFHRRYDPMKWEPAAVSLARPNAPN